MITSKEQLQKLYEEFIDECKYMRRLRPATIRGYEASFKVFLELVERQTDQNILSAGNIREFFKFLHYRERRVGKGEIVKGVKSSTVNTYWNKLNSFFKWMVSNGNIELNPLESFKPPQVTYEDRRALLKVDIQKILTAIFLYSESCLLRKRDLAIVYTLVFCGLRRAELLGLKIMDVDFDKDLLTVKGETSKSKITRYIPLNKTLVIYLCEYIDERKRQQYKTPFLFVSRNRDEALTKDGMKHWVNRISRWSGVRFHLHRFRHTFATNLGNLNVSAVKIQKLMGHKSLKMTMTYLRSIQASEMNDEIAKLDLDSFL